MDRQAAGGPHDLDQPRERPVLETGLRNRERIVSGVCVDPLRLSDVQRLQAVGVVAPVGWGHGGVEVAVVCPNPGAMLVFFDAGDIRQEGNRRHILQVKGGRCLRAG